MKVLIVEDNKITSEMLEEVLRDTHGYHVVSARSGDEALTRRVVWQPEVVILDLLIPGVAGVEFLRCLRTISDHDGQPRAPVILSSALPLDEVEARVAAIEEAGLGPIYVLHKPYEMEDMIEMIDLANVFHPVPPMPSPVVE